MNEPSTKTPLVGKGQQYRSPNESIDRVKYQVEQVKDVMRENIDKAIERGENIDALDDKSQQLEADSRIFKYKSGQVRRRFCVSYYRTIFLIVIIVAAVLGLIIWAATKS